MEIFYNKYSFPNYYNWPFFFTIQKHVDTRIKQLDMWKTILSEFCQTNKIWKISKSFFLEQVGTNKTVNRQLSTDSINLLFDYFEKTGILVFSGKDFYYVMWKNIEEWQSIIYDSVVKHHRVDTLETLDYLMHDEETAKEEYSGMDKEILVLILKSLEKKGKCKLLADDTGNSYMGVKFIRK